MNTIGMLISKIVENPYVNVIISIGLIFIGIEELYKDDVFNLKFHWKHIMSFYGLFMLFHSMFKILKGGIGIYNTHKKLKKKS
ncbi:hypothetical protein [Aquimarina sp. RZ0]|uniref:hypothetical protein n=1 Tax=Aquimarina sp. RZ0 TaxID=2607730 RepID=UPI0011F0E8CA|nr:hypothetical protein [Aquimarina sp. RZ0]KAA1247761.1 hypothetical protein F0000_02835 [Aquimarina sp. RZ0]